MTKSRRNLVLTWIVERLRTLRKKKYFVKRGAISWPTFDFDSHPYAAAVMVDDSTLFAVNGMNTANFSIEFATRMEAPGEEPSIDDDTLDLLFEDVEGVLGEIEGAKDSNGDVLLLEFRRTTVQVVEFHDASLRVQGVVVTFTVGY